MLGELIERSSAAVTAAGPHIDRSDLLRTLSRGLADRAIFIEAPAGFGKTTLVSQWIASLDRNLCTAFEMKPSHWGRKPEDIIRQFDDMLGELSARESASRKILAGQLVLLIEDYHELSSPVLDRWLTNVISRGATQFVFVILSREPIGIGLGPERLRGVATRLTERDLQFSSSEARLHLAGLASPQMIEDLVDLTGGWPIAVDLLRSHITARGGPPSDSIGEVYAQPNGSFAEFVEGEILSTISEDEREVLIRTSFLDAFDSDLAGVVSEREDCWRILEQLLRRGLIHQLPDESFHCHRLLRLILERKLRRRGAVHLSRLRKAAAEWLSTRGDLKAALQCAAPAGDVAFSTRLFLDAGGITIGLRDGFDALQRVLMELPQQCFLDPRVRAAEAYALMKSGRIDAALELLRRTEGRDSTDPLVARDLRIADLMARCSRSSTSIWTDEDGDAVIGSVPRADTMVTSGMFHNMRCVALLNSLQLSEALAHAEAATHFYEQADARNGIAHVLVHQGRMARMQGEMSNAQAFLEQARGGFLNREVPDLAGAAVADAYIGSIQAELGNLSIAEETVSVAVRQLEHGEHYWEALYAAYKTRAMIAASRDDHARSISGLEQAIAHAKRHRITQLEALLGPFLLRQALRTNHPLRGMPDGPDSLVHRPNAHWIEADLVLSCRAWLLHEQGRTDDALDILSVGFAKRTEAGLLPAALEFALDVALINNREDRKTAAASALRTALQIAAGCGIRGPFLEHLSALRPIIMLAQTSTEGAWRGSAAAALARSLLQDNLLGDGATRSLFSKNEQQILNGIAAGRSNKDIARQLNVSPDTVRFHLKNIYGKFNISEGHANRKIVAMLAREHGLIIQNRTL